MCEKAVGETELLNVFVVLWYCGAPWSHVPKRSSDLVAAATLLFR